MGRSQKLAQQKQTERQEGYVKPPEQDTTAIGANKSLLDLQEAAGNQAVSHLLTDGKTAATQSDDPAEQAAEDTDRTILDSSHPERSSPEAAQASEQGVDPAGVALPDQGRPLSEQERAFFETRLDQDLSQVRLHTGEEAAGQADRLNAKAFTSGQNIVLGSEAPDLQSPGGKRLLAHELSHVVQQRQAAVTEYGVGQPEEAAEKQAESAAGKIMQGQPGQIQASGTVPAIQRKPADKKLAERADVEAALRKFFERSRQAQGEDAFRITAHVKKGIELVFSEDPFGWLNIQSLLNRLDYPGDPADFARQVAAGLSGPIDRRLLDRLARLPVRDKPPGRLGRLKRLIKRTKPGKSPKIGAPDPLSSQKRFKQGVADLEKQSKQARPETETKPSAGQKAKSLLLKPRSVDVLRLGRIAAGLPEAIRGPKPAPPAQAVSELPPEVEQAIQTQVQPDALVPPGAKEDAANFPDGQETARAVARLLDQAHHNGENKANLDLGDHYRGVKTMLPILKELQRIALVVKKALPHQAPGVTRLEVHYAGKVAPIRLNPSSREKAE